MTIGQRLLLVLLAVILNALATQQNSVAHNYSNDILRLAKAAQMKAYLDVEKGPCDNFYKFACGKWSRLHPATEATPKTSYLDQLQSLMVRKSAEMLKGDYRSDADEKTLMDFFESCHGKQPHEHDMDSILKLVGFRGGWPKVTSEAWYKSEYDWLKVVAELRQHVGVDILIGLDVVPDFVDKDMHRIKVGAPTLELKSKAVYLNDKYKSKRDDYVEGIADKLHWYFSDMPRSWAKEVAEQVLSVEQQLAKGLSNDERLTLEETSSLRYTAELKQAYGSYVDLSRYLNFIFNQTLYVQVYETPESYLSNLVEVIKNTPKLTIANYTMWRVLKRFSAEVTEHQDEKWCAHKVMEYFPHQLETMFHRNYNNMQQINDLQSVWADVRRTFREVLQSEQSWLSQDTRQRALQKLDAMKLEIVTHQEKYGLEQLHNRISENKYYENLINILQWQTTHKLAKLIEKPEPADEELKYPSYQFTANKIRIPITFLQARFFWDAAYPNALKYSTIGFVLARTMAEGFGARGREYDSHGYKRNWFDSASENAYNQSETCFSKQFANYKFHGKKLTLPNTLSTSMADNAGLSVAYRAYQNWWMNVADNQLSSKEVLPLLEYTQYQLFFVGFAQLLCADYHESTKNFTEIPERLRVIGALANFNEFAVEFKCKNGDKMNPENKCKTF